MLDVQIQYYVIKCQAIKKKTYFFLHLVRLGNELKALQCNSQLSMKNGKYWERIYHDFAFVLHLQLRLGHWKVG